MFKLERLHKNKLIYIKYLFKINFNNIIINCYAFLKKKLKL